MVLHMLRFDLNAPSVLALDHLQDSLDELVCDMCHMGPTLGRADRVHVADLAEGVVAQADCHLPALPATLVDAGSRPLIQATRTQIQLRVVLEAVYLQLLAIQNDPAPLVRGAGDVVSTLHHEPDNVVVQPCHAELRQIRPEGHTCEISTVEVDDRRRVPDGHVALVDLGELLSHRLICSLEDELRGEDIRQLRAISVPASCHLLLVVVVIVAGK
mmetsp:Transcript_52732/g.151046  ORF Transcript_52732/g.151046 Transcript_52732/m.151046 type:complete len:215 (-) Transcript_52732:455-1099(-)